MSSFSQIMTFPESTNRPSRTKMITLIGIFAAISTLLMFIEMPIPFMPPFLKVDISGVPILLMAFLYGPGPAIYVTLVKDLVHLLSTQTGGVGELADFLILSSFAVVASFVYQKSKSPKKVLFATGAGIVTITIVGCLANRFLLIPFYEKIMPIDAIIGACQAINPLIDGLDAYIIFGAAPFNMIKGVILSLLTYLLYRKMAGFIKSRLA